MYGNIFRFFVCLSHAHTNLDCSFWFHGYKTLLSMLEWRKKNQPRSTNNIRNSCTRSEWSEEKIWVRQYISIRLTTPYSKENVLGKNSPLVESSTSKKACCWHASSCQILMVKVVTSVSYFFQSSVNPDLDQQLMPELLRLQVQRWVVAKWAGCG